MANKSKSQRPAVLASIETNTWAAARALSHAAGAGGGLFFVMDSATPPPVGTHVGLALKLPDETLVGLSAVVVHQIASSSARERGAAPGFGVRVESSHVAELELVRAAATHHSGDAAPTTDEGCVVLRARVGTGAGFALRTEVAYLLPAGAAADEGEDQRTGADSAAPAAPLVIESSRPRRGDEASTGVALPASRQISR